MTWLYRIVARVIPARPSVGNDDVPRSPNWLGPAWFHSGKYGALRFSNISISVLICSVAYYFLFHSRFDSSNLVRGGIGVTTGAELNRIVDIANANDVIRGLVGACIGQDPERLQFSDDGPENGTRDRALSKERVFPISAINGRPGFSVPSLLFSVKNGIAIAPTQFESNGKRYIEVIWDQSRVQNIETDAIHLAGFDAAVPLPLQPTEMAVGSGMLSISSRIHDFGRSPYLAQLKHSVNIQNVGSTVLQILRPITKCGCTITRAIASKSSAVLQGGLVFQGG